jgi:hypothetical protein
MIRRGRSDIVVLYENRKISRPLHLTPVFSEDDVGINQLFLVYSAAPLAIKENEVETGPDRLAEIINQAEENKRTLGIKIREPIGC